MEAPERIYLTKHHAALLNREQAGIIHVTMWNDPAVDPVEYVRADLLAAKDAENEKMLALLNEWLDEPAEWTDERIGYEVRQIGKELIESTRAALGGEA